MEGALLAFAAKTGAEATGWTRQDEIPFDAAHRYVAVLVEGPDQQRLVLVTCMGAELLEMTSHERAVLRHRVAEEGDPGAGLEADLALGRETYPGLAGPQARGSCWAEGRSGGDRRAG